MAQLLPTSRPLKTAEPQKVHEMRQIALILALVLPGPLVAANGQDALETPALRRVTSLRGLLEARNLGELETTLAAIEEETRGDYKRENELWAAYIYLTQPRPENEELFAEWLALTGSSRARLGRAMFLAKRGWRVRGDDWAHRTSDSQFASMAEYHAEAHRLYVDVLEKNPECLMAYDGLMSLCLGAGDKQCSERWLQKGLAVSPGSFNLRAAYLYVLKPRWAGSYAEMDAFAAKSQEAVELNPRLRHLLGFADADRADFAEPAAKIELFTRALKHGPEPGFLAGRAHAYYETGQTTKALEDLLAARELSPVGWFYSDMRLAHSMSLQGIIVFLAGEPQRGRELIRRASAIEVGQKYVLWWLSQVEKDPR